MSRSVNKVTLVGNVGGDPEIRSTQGGVKVATLSLATARQWTAANGEKQEKTEWHKLVVWGSAKGEGLAGVVEKYVGKGDKLYVEGAIEYRQYEKDGETRYVTEIKVSDLVLLGGKREGGETAAPSKGKAQATRDRGEDDDLPF